MESRGQKFLQNDFCKKRYDIIHPAKKENEITHTARLRHFKYGGYELMALNMPQFREPGWEDINYEKRKYGKVGIAAVETGGDSRQQAADNDHESRLDNQRRAARRVREYALSTDFRYFVTLTLDAEKVDRYDEKAVIKKLTRWLDNQVNRKGLAYVIVPERHKDGALHFHGLINDALRVEDSGTISMPGDKKPRRPRSQKQREEWLEQGGHVVYNLPEWRIGFTTAIELYGDYDRAVNYVCKYITKLPEKITGRWYYSGGDLGEPEVLEYLEMDVRELEIFTGAKGYQLPANYLVVWRGDEAELAMVLVAIQRMRQEEMERGYERWGIGFGDDQCGIES